MTAVKRANVNVSSDRHLWHDFVRRYNLMEGRWLVDGTSCIRLTPKVVISKMEFVNWISFVNPSKTNNQCRQSQNI